MVFWISYLGTGDTDYAELMPNVLYWNQAGQRFVDVTFASGLGICRRGMGSYLPMWTTMVMWIYSSRWAGLSRRRLRRCAI